MSENGEHKATVNGVVKGRPGKGRVLSLGQRKQCYHGHKMTEDNTFRYTKKPTQATPKPIEREWCKRCRGISRVASAARRRTVEAKIAAQQKREAKEATPSEQARADKVAEELARALSDNGKAKPAPKAVKPKRAEGKVAKPARKVATSGKVACGACGETFPDPPTATKHIVKCTGKVKVA